MKSNKKSLEAKFISYHNENLVKQYLLSLIHFMSDMNIMKQRKDKPNYNIIKIQHEKTTTKETVVSSKILLSKYINVHCTKRKK